MNNDNNQIGIKQGNNFLSGFLFGVLVGALTVFLFGTKRGKRLLKVISEKGAGNISDILEKMDKSINTDEILEDESAPVKMSKEENVIKKPAVRRFFRGISRHAN